MLRFSRIAAPNLSKDSFDFGIVDLIWAASDVSDVCL